MLLWSTFFAASAAESSLKETTFHLLSIAPSSLLCPSLELYSSPIQGNCSPFIILYSNSGGVCVFSIYFAAIFTEYKRNIETASGEKRGIVLCVDPFNPSRQQSTHTHTPVSGHILQTHIHTNGTSNLVEFRFSSLD